jgi:mxaL protein
MSKILWQRVFFDMRSLCLVGVMLCLLAAVLAPHVMIARATYELLVAIDITQSMNARDYTLDGRPASRLAKVSRVLRDLLLHLPCGSRIGLAVFTERRSFLLFEPIDICRDFAPLDGALAALDWRMAWEGDSHIASGLYSAIDIAKSLGADLVFLSDGHEAPPLPHNGPPPFDGKPGEVQGVVVGVGGTSLVPIPKFTADGREIGFFEMSDVEQENRFGLPPQSAEEREGWHPRNAPFGAEAASGSEHLTSVKEGHLRDIAAKTGLVCAPLTDASDLAAAIFHAAKPRPADAPMDFAPLPASLALLLLVVLFGVLPSVERNGADVSHMPRIFRRCKDLL